MKYFKQLVFIMFISLTMVISFSLTAFADSQVQEITFSTKVVNQNEKVLVTLKTSEPIVNAKLYLEGQYGTASSYTQLVAQMFTKVDDYTWQGTVYPGYVAGYTFYPSWLEYTSLSTGKQSTIFFDKNSFPDARFTVYKNWEEELTEKVTVAAGSITSRYTVKFSPTESYDFSYPFATYQIEDNSIADAIRAGFGLGSDYYWHDIMVQGISPGTTKIFVTDYQTKAICKIFEVTVTEPETVSQTICIGDTVTVPVEYNSDTLRFGFSPSASYENGVVNIEDSCYSYPNQTMDINSNYLNYNKGTFSVKVNSIGTYYLYLYDNSMNPVKTVKLTVNDHQFDTGTVIQEKNCSQHEVKEYICLNCGKKEQREGSDFGGHKWSTEYTIDKQPTCIEEGSKSIHCSVCNAVEESTVEVIQKTAHKYGEWKITKEATCTGEGSKEKNCEICDDTVIEVIPATGHTQGEEVTENEIEASCKADGSYDAVIYCRECHEELSREAKTIPALGHDLTHHEAQAPTCTEIGWEAYDTCSRCDYTTYKEIPAAGHKYVTTVSEPTCTAGGYSEHVCSVCKDTYRDNETPAKGHSFGEWTTTVSPTCTEDGSRYRECADCGLKETEGIDPTGHNFSTEFTVDKEPTCTEDGSRSYHCLNDGCTVVTGSETVPALGHDYKDVEGSAVAETCEEAGKQADKKCSHCGETITGETIPTLGHDWGEWTVTKEATTTEEGVETRVCKRDPSHTESRAIPKKEITVDGITRIFGSSRYDTSIKSADALKEQLGLDKFDNVIIACGTNYADALAGSYLSCVKKAPILLVRNRQTEIDLVQNYIKANLNQGGTIYLLGGSAVVPDAATAGLSGYNVRRLWGADRYATNVAILEEAGVSGDEIIVASGTGFADSLSASATGKPILLVKNVIQPSQKAYVESLAGKKFYLIGGTGAVNADIEKYFRTLGSVTRLGGATRFDTSVKVAETFFANPKVAVLAYGQDFPDGLCGGSVANAMGGPLLLATSSKSSQAAAYTKANGIKFGAVLGGPTLINDAAVRTIFQMGASDKIVVK